MEFIDFFLEVRRAGREVAECSVLGDGVPATGGEILETRSLINYKQENPIKNQLANVCLENLLHGTCILILPRTRAW